MTQWQSTACGMLALMGVTAVACEMERLTDVSVHMWLGECDNGCHAALWIDATCEHFNGDIRSTSHMQRVAWVFNGREPRLDEWARATNALSCWLLQWRTRNRT